MFYSLLIKLKANESGKIIKYSGQKLHAVFLKLIKNIDESLSEKLHSQEFQKAFTVSGLFNQKNTEMEISENKFYYFRVTLLSDELYKAFSKAMLKVSFDGLMIEIEDMKFSVKKIIYEREKSKWANKFNIGEILESDMKHKIKIRFCSPTLFKSGDTYVSSPNVEIIFKGLLNKFNKHYMFNIKEEVLEKLKEVRIIRQNIKIVKVEMNKFYLNGFLGDITFKLESEKKEVVDAFNILSEFAFYSGIGYKTTMGFGQVLIER